MQKLIITFITFCICLTAYAQNSQTRTAGNVVINHRVSDWINYSPAAFAGDDDLYAHTKITSGQHPVFFDHFGFNIPADATITKLVCTVKKFKSGKSEVKDLDGVTWFLARCNCSFTPDCNCDYGPVMRDLNPWSATQTAVSYEQPGTGSFTKTVTLSDGTRTKAGTRTIVTENYSWTPAMVNDIMFGFTFNPTINIKGGGAAIFIGQLTVTVYYTTPSTTTAAAKIVPENDIRLSATNNSVLVDALMKGRYLLTVTDRFGTVLQKQFITNPNKERLLLNTKAKGYIIISVEGMGVKKSLQTFVE